MALEQTTFTRDELSRALPLGSPVIDALFQSHGRPLNGERVLDGAQLERLFCDSLLGLYQAHAQHSHAVAAGPEPPLEIELEDNVEVIPIKEETPEPERSDLRLAARYTPRRQLIGMFRDVKATILQLSNTGLRIRHSESLRPGEEARLSIALTQPTRSFIMRAKIVWTSLAQNGDGPSFFISGLRVTANPERLTTAVDLLRMTHQLQIAPSDDRRRGARQVPRAVTGLADDDVAAIIRAVRKFASDPAEATRWYTRARFAVTDEVVRKAAPRAGREREEVLGIWEYLQRRVDIAAVAGVMRWIRNSQAHA